MIKENKIYFRILIIVFSLFPIKAGSEILTIGNPDSKVVIKVFSSLTCPACANFHSKVFFNLKKDFISKNLVKFEHHPFPLDLAALNAEIILRCHVDSEKKFELLSKIYEKQKLWAVGSDIIKINEAIKRISQETGLKKEKIDTCLKDEKAQDEVLNQRIAAQKNYKIEATPTVLINEKKYTGKIEYKEFKKIIEKYL